MITLALILANPQTDAHVLSDEIVSPIGDDYFRWVFIFSLFFPDFFYVCIEPKQRLYYGKNKG